jgi:hypothetical protein
MLHRIHAGGGLDEPESYEVIGFGAAPYPNNFTAHRYDHVVFPVMNGGVRSCATCHGAGNAAWIEPADRDHPTVSAFAREWLAACGSCHDGAATLAHIDLQTLPDGRESCAVCHGRGAGESVERAHRVR